MKRTIVATIAVLMSLCVLPMAQARESAPRDVGRVRHNVAVPVRTEGDNQQTQDQLSQKIATLQARLAQLKAQQQDLQKQLQALTGQSYEPQGDRRAPAVRREGARGRLPRQRASGDLKAQGAPSEPMAGRGGGAPGRPKVAGRDGAAYGSQEQSQREQDVVHLAAREAARARHQAEPKRTERSQPEGDF